MELALQLRAVPFSRARFSSAPKIPPQQHLEKEYLVLQEPEGVPSECSELLIADMEQQDGVKNRHLRARSRSARPCADSNFYLSVRNVNQWLNDL